MEKIREHEGILIGVGGLTMTVSGCLHLIDVVLAICIGVVTLVLLRLKIRERRDRMNRVTKYLERHKFDDASMEHMYGKPKEEETD